MNKNHETGKKGEPLSVDFLVQNNYQILETNWRFQKVEIDIISKLENTLVLEICFDIINIVLSNSPKIEHLKNAF